MTDLFDEISIERLQRGCWMAHGLSIDTITWRRGSERGMARFPVEVKTRPAVVRTICYRTLDELVQAVREACPGSSSSRSSGPGVKVPSLDSGEHGLHSSPEGQASG